MARWVKCTSAVESGRTVWVNLDQVIARVPSEQGTEIKGIDGFAFPVKETPEYLLEASDPSFA